MKDKGTNITPILEHILGTSEIDSAEDLQKLIDTLESMPEDTIINTENMAKIMDVINSNKKNENKKIDYVEFIENNIIDCDVSRSGGTLKIDVSKLFPSVENAIMGVYQTHHGDEISDSSQFNPDELTKEEQVVFYEMRDVLNKFFKNLIK